MQNVHAELAGVEVLYRSLNLPSERPPCRGPWTDSESFTFPVSVSNFRLVRV